MPIYSTFANELSFAHFVEIHSEEDVYRLMDQWIFGSDFYLLGKWANTLFVGDYSWTVVRNAILGKEILSENDNEIVLRVWAGEDWEEFVLWTIAHGYLWLENLVSIPGSVWASPVQNIGAYGVEVGNVVSAVEWIALDQGVGHLVSLDTEACHFAYRNSIFKSELKGKFLITHVVFTLHKNMRNYNFTLAYQGLLDVMKNQEISESELTQAQLAEIISSIRASKLPDYKKLWTAGSFFKNPIVSKERYAVLKQDFPQLVSFDVEDPSTCKLSAGQLIDICGLKNYRLGNVGTYTKHALVLVNYGWASGQEIWEFAKFIQDQVYKKFEIMLSPEVNIIK